MEKFKVLMVGAALLALGALAVTQMRSQRETASRLAALETRLADLESAPAVVTPAGGERPVARADFSRQLAELERVVSELSKSTNAPRERGQQPMTAEQLAELRRKLADGSLSEKDRLQALRLLRRNNGLTDDVAQSALALLQNSTNRATRLDVLQQLAGATNALLRQPLLELAATSTDPKVREEATQNLLPFAADPDVERRLWEMAKNDADPKVREQAEEALRKGPMTAERAGRLQQVAADAQAGLDDRLTAMRALVRAGVDVGGVSAALAESAQSTQDPLARAKIYKALDGVQDTRILAPLVNGLQDAVPDVRKEAAETLGRFSADPQVRRWLEYVAQSDTDSQVRREAFQALKKFQEGKR